MHILKKGLLTCLAMMTMSMGFLTSCSDEDEGGGFVTQTDAGDFDGTRLIAVDYGNNESTRFNYLADGTLHQIVDGDERITFDYKTGTVTYTDDEDSEEKARFTTNEKGYITEFSGSGSDEEDEWTVNYRFQYNSSGHLTNATCNQVNIDHATSVKETTDITWKLTWNGDLLSSVESNGVDNYGEWGGNKIYTYTDALDNRYMQYTSLVIGRIDLDAVFEEFMYVGLLGKGPSKYPSKIESKSGDQMSEVYAESITYELNSKGLVERENINYSDDSWTRSVDYLYDGLSNASASAADRKVGVDNKLNKNSRNHISPFGRKK